MDMYCVMYCVYDTVAELASPPFLQPNDSAAKRAFVQLMRESNRCGSADYMLYRIGFWNASNAILCGADYPEVIMSSAEVNENEKAQD